MKEEDLAGLLPRDIPFNNLKRKFRIGKDLPECDAAVFHNCFPGGEQAPTFGFIAFEGAGGETEKSEAVISFRQIDTFDFGIRKPFEVAGPPGDHPFLPDDLIPVSTDEGV